MTRRICLFLLAMYLITVWLMYLYQRQMIYFPSTEPADTDYLVKIIDSGEIQLKVLVDNPQREEAVIYFGGNGENVYRGATRMQTAFADRAAYYVNYPGYGGSGGVPTEQSIIQGARDVYLYVRARHANIVLAGRSLGTGVAVNLASQYPVQGLILISPYDSLAALASRHYPFFPGRWLIKDKFDSVSRARKITTKVLILLAAKDKVIPLSHSQKLVDVFKLSLSQPSLGARLKVKVYQGADHNNLHLRPGFMQQIRDFMLP